MHSREDRDEAEFPPLTRYQDWLCQTATSIGLSFNGQPIPYTEIKAWVQLTGTRLTPWETRTVRQLSEAYLIEHERTREEQFASPVYMSDAWRARLARKAADARIAQLKAAANQAEDINP